MKLARDGYLMRNIKERRWCLLFITNAARKEARVYARTDREDCIQILQAVAAYLPASALCSDPIPVIYKYNTPWLLCFFFEVVAAVFLIKRAR